MVDWSADSGDDPAFNQRWGLARPRGAPVLVPRRYVAEGNFVLALVEARTEPPTANYDLFRVQNGKIAEHWDVLSPIPPRNQWKNANGPF